uniref:Mov34/MPN/PAD-1 n=1 Tax=uncultured bacterium contig00070 TaxID=1181551 RepID=A0A806KRC4_9BACT|nr:Mov34/MPN/PAD-1 [uncultured bacterium contig00070]
MPNEACGLIAGRDEGDARIVEKVYLLSNPDKSPEHFSIDPKEQLAAAKNIRLSYDPKASYLILSLASEPPVLKAFGVAGEWLRGRRWRWCECCPQHFYTNGIILNTSVCSITNCLLNEKNTVPSTGEDIRPLLPRRLPIRTFLGCRRALCLLARLRLRLVCGCASRGASSILAFLWILKSGGRRLRRFGWIGYGATIRQNPTTSIKHKCTMCRYILSEPEIRITDIW